VGCGTVNIPDEWLVPVVAIMTKAAGLGDWFLWNETKIPQTGFDAADTLMSKNESRVWIWFVVRNLKWGQFPDSIYSARKIPDWGRCNYHNTMPARWGVISW